MVNVSINGAGRIGLIFFRILAQRINSGAAKNLNLVLINDPFATLEDIKYRLVYDSAHGIFQEPVEVCEETSTIKVGQSVKVLFSREREPQNVPYKQHGVQLVVECSGAFCDFEKASLHLAGGKNGVQHVLISAPAQGDQVKTLVYGVNHHEFDPAKHQVLSNASCTTNCLAPVLKALREAFGGIKWSLITTTHAATASQKVVDGVSPRDFASGRAALNNIIPASTGAARAISKVYPDLAGRLDGVALRVPVVDVSVTDFVAEVNDKITVEAAQKCFQNASESGDLKGILGVAHQGAVSSDFLGNPLSAVVELGKLMVAEGRVVKGLAFYDNEVGYSTRLADMLQFLASKLK